MEMHPWDFYNYTLPEFELKRKGFRERRIDEERIFRRMALLSVAPWADKRFDIYKAWPIENDEELKKSSSDDSMWEKLKQKSLKLKEDEQTNGG